MLADWEKGVKLLRDECIKAGGGNRPLQMEENLAEHIGLSLGSMVNIIRYCLFYRQFKASKSIKQKKTLETKLVAIARQELITGLRDIDLVKFDSRLGYHPEAHVHLFTIDDLKFKISRCKEICDLGVR